MSIVFAIKLPLFQESVYDFWSLCEGVPRVYATGFCGLRSLVAFGRENPAACIGNRFHFIHNLHFGWKDQYKLDCVRLSSWHKRLLWCRDTRTIRQDWCND